MWVKIEVTKDKGVWGYGGMVYDHRVRFIAVGVGKTKFMQTVAKIEHGGVSWIRERISESGNKNDVMLARKYSGKILVTTHSFDTNGNKLLELYTEDGELIWRDQDWKSMLVKEGVIDQ